MDLLGGEPSVEEVKIEVDPHTIEVDGGMVTVEDSAGKCFNLQLNSCCIFCRKKLLSNGDPLEGALGVPYSGSWNNKLSPPGFLTTFNWVWNVVQRDGGGLGKGFSWRQVVGLEEGQELGQGRTRFRTLPKMCQVCGDKVLEVDKLMNQTWKQVWWLRQAVLDSLSWTTMQRTSGLISDKETLEFLRQFWNVVLGRTKPSGTSVSIKPQQNPVSVSKPVQQSFGTKELSSRISQSQGVQVKTEDSLGSSVITEFSTSYDNQVDEAVAEIKSEIEEDAELKDKNTDSGTEEESDTTSNSIDDDKDSSESEDGDNVEELLEAPKPVPKRKGRPPLPRPSKLLKPPKTPKPKYKKKRSQRQLLYLTQPNQRTRCLPITCKICGKVVRYNALSPHMRTVHSVILSDSIMTKNTTQRCDLCQDLIHRNEIRSHLLSHISTEDYLLNCPRPGCPRLFIHPSSLIAHLETRKTTCHKSVENREAFIKSLRTCQVCGFYGDNRCSLKTHLQIQHETAEKNHSCPISNCEGSFTLKQSVQHHLYDHQLKKPNLKDAQERMHCMECKKLVETEKMESHLKEVHGATEIVQCSYCPLKLSSRGYLLDHLFSHLKQPLYCDICGNGPFKLHSKLVEHYFTQHQIGNQWQCELCPEVFWREVALKIHMACKHRGNQVIGKTFNCQDCNAVLKTEHGLRSHRIKEHGAELYGCQLCSEKSFKNLHALKQHEKEVHKGIQEEISCEYPNCGKTFKSVSLLKVHQDGVHSMKKGSFKCNQCGKSFLREKGLELHRKRIHLGKGYRFFCEEPNCGKSFCLKTGLVNHQKKVHLGEASSLVCEQCGQGFELASHLKRHVEEMHLREKKYVCDICMETFPRRNSLKRHKLIHTGERPFNCDICEQGFRYKEVLKRHLRSHQEKGAEFKPNGPMKKLRKRVEMKRRHD